MNSLPGRLPALGVMAVCLAALAITATVPGGLPAHGFSRPLAMGDVSYVPSVAVVLLLTAGLFLAWIFRSDHPWRFSGGEVAFCFFLAAAVPAGIFASDRRAAVTDILMLCSGPMAALAILQVLDDRRCIRAVLAIIAALGVVSAYQCAEQYFWLNQAFVEQYQRDPLAVLGPLGIEPGSFPQMLFEHRLYSRDVNGFFTTGNSAGSFGILAFYAALALLADTWAQRQGGRLRGPALICCATAMALVLSGLLLAHSKGAIVSLAFSLPVLFCVLKWGDFLRRNRRAVLLSLVSVAGGAVVLAAWYGLTRGLLPGGNSMFVRWQYWVGACRMWMEHPLFGVGPGNFGYFYTHYKPAAALESVLDPHNFLLSLLAQYGPVGMAAFVGMLAVPLWRAVFQRFGPPSSGPAKEKTGAGALFFALAVSMAAMLLRPVVMDQTGPTRDYQAAVFVYLYIIPIAVLAAGAMCFFCTFSVHGALRAPVSGRMLACGIAAVLAHSLIDYAVFEPGVYIGMWMLVACMVATGYEKGRFKPVVFRSSRLAGTAVFSAAVLMGISAVGLYLVPVTRNATLIRRSGVAQEDGRIEEALSLLSQAALADSLDPGAPALAGRLYLRRSAGSPAQSRAMLHKAEEWLLLAIERNTADFKNYQRLSDVYIALAAGDDCNIYLEKAFKAAGDAVERYPGLGRLWFLRAGLADRLGKKATALECYRRSVQIEDAYRGQFRLMYPGREVFSRLGEESYRFAREQLETGE